MAEAAVVRSEDEEFAAAFEEAVKATVSQDTMPAAGGADTAGGEDDEDTVAGAAGKDTVQGGGAAADTTVPKDAPGPDTTEGASGKDTVPAGTGEDTVAGATGEDTAPAATGTDQPGTDTAAATDRKAAPERDEKEPELTPEQKAEQERVRQETEAALADYKFTPEEEEAFSAWKKDFPKEAVALEARFKQIDRVITQRVYNASLAVLQRIESVIAPALRGYQETAEERHYSTIAAAHKDYDEVQPLLSPWVEKQPAAIASAYREILERGDADSVIYLISQFKTATGRTKSSAAPAAPSKPAAPAKSAPSKDDVDALAVVDTKRSTPTPSSGAPNMDDFDGAWDEATRRSK